MFSVISSFPNGPLHKINKQKARRHTMGCSQRSRVWGGWFDRFRLSRTLAALVSATGAKVSEAMEKRRHIGRSVVGHSKVRFTAFLLL